MKKIMAILIMSVLAMAGIFVFSQTSDAKPSTLTPDLQGPIPVGTLNTTFTDRYSTSISIVVFYPANVSGNNAPANFSAAPYPGIHFCHGHIHYPPYDYYATWGSHWASWGYVVVMGNYQTYDQLLTSDHSKITNSTIDALNWIRTQNHTSGSKLFGMVNENVCALAGHSLGGKCTVLAAEQAALLGLTYIEAIAPLAMSDSTIGSNPSSIPGLGLIHIPVQLQCGANDLVAPPASNSQLIYNGLTYHNRQFINITGGTHYWYADKNITMAVGDGTPTITRTAFHMLGFKYSTAFFNYYLKHETTYYTYIYGADMNTDVGAGTVTNQVDVLGVFEWVVPSIFIAATVIIILLTFSRKQKKCQ